MERFLFNSNILKARVVPGLLALCVLVLASGDVMAQSTNELSSRINRLENEINTLNRAVYRGETPPAGTVSGGGGGKSAADAEIRLQQMERDVRELRGMLEQKDYEVRQLRSELERVRGDLELRLQDLEKGASVSSAAPSSPSGGAKYTTGQATGRYDGAASAASGQLGSYLKTPNGTLASDGGDAAALYDNAFSRVKNSQYAAAEKEFSSFLAKYPDHELSGNAKYWLGESHYVRGQYEKAARIFAEGYQQYPKGAKASDNLLKLGMSLAGLGKTQDACVALAQLEKNKVAGSGPVLRRAEQEKQRLGC